MKIGDWVKFISNKPNDYCDGEILQITNIDDRGFCHFGDYNKLYSIGLLELWQPKEGEWCWFWNKDSEMPPVLRRFKQTQKDGAHITKVEKKSDDAPKAKTEPKIVEQIQVNDDDSIPF